jgi:transcriptional regulator GlxA family with amidase domain
MGVSARQVQQYQGLVDKFEQVARENVENLAHVADLCHLAGLNQRTLSRAFREIRGIGPAGYVQQLRLSEVRRVLLFERATVTEAAMRFGFHELGHFGTLYRKAFGERPSETKRRGRWRNGELQSEVSLIPGELVEINPQTMKRTLAE